MLFGESVTQIVKVYCNLFPQQSVECVGLFYYMVFGKETLSMYIRFAVCLVRYVNTGLFVLLPDELTPVYAVGVYRSAVIEYYAFN